MPATRDSRARRYDQDIHEALVAGHTPAQVAAQLGLSLEEVQAAEKRVRAAQRKLPPDEEARQRMLLAYRIIGEQSMQAWQRSVNEGEESTVVSSDGKEGKKAQRTTHKQAGDPRYLDRAMKAMAQEAKMRGLDEPVCKSPPKEKEARASEAASGDLPEHIDKFMAEMELKRTQHPKYQEWLDLRDELDAGHDPSLDKSPGDVHRRRLQHPKYLDFVDLTHEIDSGMPPPPIQEWDSRYKPPEQEKGYPRNEYG